MSDSTQRQDKSGTPDHGPTEAPPNLPRGWIAQWDAKAGKYYFVQLSTSHAQWELPTEPAPGVDTPSSTPMSGANSQFPRPMGSPNQSKNNAESNRGLGADDGTEGERGFGSMAMNMLAGKQNHGAHQSGLTGLAQSFLSSQGSHSGSHASSGSGGAGSVAASLLSNVLGSGNKPHNQAPGGSQHTAGMGGSSASHSAGHSSAGNMLGGLFGGHNAHNQQSQFGYASGPSPAGGYSGTAPPAQYQPSIHNQQSYGSSNDPYNPGGYQGHSDHHGMQTPAGNQYGSGQSGHSYPIQRPSDPSKPFYVGGTPFDEPGHGYGGSHQSQTTSNNYSQGPQGQYPTSQYGGHPQPFNAPSSAGYDSHHPPGKPSQYGQPGAYGSSNQQYPPPPTQGGYGGASQGYGSNPRY